MRYSILLVIWIAGLSFAAHAFTRPEFSNRIEGIVWDPNRRPVPDVYVELLNSVEGDLARARTNGAGRFTFNNLSTGRFKLRVITTGTNLLEESLDVEIEGTALRNSSETKFVDFNLRYDKRKVSFGSDGPAEAVFAQEIPARAKKLYEKGLSDIETEKGLKLLEDAIAAYPDYFDALSAAGKQYVSNGDFAKGAVYLVRAVRVNPRSYSSYTTLAYAAYKLNKIPEATEAARSAVVLEPKAVNSRVLLGRLLRLGSNLKMAEGILLETMKMAPDAPLVHYEFALVLNRLGRNAEAADELGTYLKLSPNATDRKGVEELIAKLKNNQ